MAESEASHAQEIRDESWQTREMQPQNPPDGSHDHIGYQGQPNG